MIVKTYTAKDGSHLKDKDAERIGLFLERKFGEQPLSPGLVVAAARPKTSQIHQDFEWDDKIAGGRYRDVQAQKLLRSIEVVFSNGEEREPTRAFHRVFVQGEGEPYSAYVPATVVWQSPDYSMQVVETAKRELISWTKTFRGYELLAKQVAIVDRVIAELEDVAA